MQARPVQISLEKSQVLKGLAIIPVVLIHYLAYLQGIYTVSKFHLFFIALDQLGRYCVPLFILLSGYGLALRYKNEQPSVVPFIKGRALKLLPLYLLWSVVSYILLSVVPAWQTTGIHQPLWYQLLTGSADYQLYFVILIFQLYIVFPFFLRFVRKFPMTTLILSFVIQLLLFAYYRSYEVPGQNNLDGVQYMYFASWIGYFVLGIWLAIRPLPVKLYKLFLPLTLIGGTIVVWHTWYLIKNQVDPLLALKFTRWPITLYTVSLMLWLITTSGFSRITHPAKNKLKKVLNIFGKDSYLIFLAHTIGLRIIFSTYRELISIPLAIMLTCTWLVTILLSKKMSSN